MFLLREAMLNPRTKFARPKGNFSFRTWRKLRWIRKLKFRVSNGSRKSQGEAFPLRKAMLNPRTTFARPKGNFSFRIWRKRLWIRKWTFLLWLSAFVLAINTSASLGNEESFVWKQPRNSQREIFSFLERSRISQTEIFEISNGIFFTQLLLNVKTKIPLKCLAVRFQN